MELGFALSLVAVIAAGCNDEDGDGPDGASCGPVTAGPTEGSDARSPQLGENACVLDGATVSATDALIAEDAHIGPAIELKYELDDAGKLSLSVYPIADLSLDAERQSFVEVAGDPTVPWSPGEPEVFADAEHLKRSARDLTLVQLSETSLADVVDAASTDGFVFWAIPTIEDGRAGYGVYTLNDDDSTNYAFVDGGAANEPGIEDLGEGPGSGATDARAPEVPDLGILATARTTMAEGIAAAEAQAGPVIEAKFEVGEDGNLSLSLYPVVDVAMDPERTTFTELAGDPTSETLSLSSETFAEDDFEHLTRSSRDLTIAQLSSLSLGDAVGSVEAEVPGGFVYWAIPTRRGTQPGYGVYVYDVAEEESRYFFVH